MIVLEGMMLSEPCAGICGHTTAHVKRVSLPVGEMLTVAQSSTACWMPASCR